MMLWSFITRSGAELKTADAVDNDDNVELEKSNVLLMGPTGSGMRMPQHYYLFSTTCCEKNCLIWLL